MRELSKNTILGLSAFAISTLILGNFFYKRYTNSATAKLAVLSEQTDSLLVNSDMLSIDKMTDTAIISLTDANLTSSKTNVGASTKIYSEPILEGDKLPVKSLESVAKATEKVVKKNDALTPQAPLAERPNKEKTEKNTIISVVERPSKEKIEKPVTIAVVEKEAMAIEKESHEVVAAKNVSEAKYYVIVGTFNNKENAELELKKTPNKQLSVFKDGRYFRVSAGNFSDKKEANNVAKSLNTEGVACFVIQR
jgi:hypothetical protein